MAIEVFNRFEKKFFMNSKTYFRVTEELKKYMELDPYSDVGKGYTISNIYYDTSDDLLVRRSLSKPVYKEKLRLRGYGVPEENGKVYLEIKKKFNGLVNKRRTTLYLNEAYDFIKTGKVPDYKEYMNLQVLKEIEYFLKCYKLVPAAYVAYDCRFVNDVLQKRLKEFTEIDKRVDVVNGSFPIKRTHREFIVVTVMHL